MHSRKWIPLLALAVLFAVEATPLGGQEAIGKATSVKRQAESVRVDKFVYECPRRKCAKT
jgi:hypothetical protein